MVSESEMKDSLSWMDLGGVWIRTMVEVELVLARLLLRRVVVGGGDGRSEARTTPVNGGRLATSIMGEMLMGALLLTDS